MYRLLLVALLAFSQPLLAAAPGQAAPPLALADGQGQTLDLASLRGKLVYVDFWASWCGPCRQSFPFMNQLLKQYGDAGLVVLAVNVDAEAKDAAAFLARYPAQFTVLYDAAGNSAKAWAVAGMPSSYLIDRQGRVRASHLGFRADSAAKITSEIDALLKETVTGN
ncbi:TlpA family protein disulfide reductase [Chitinimonas sp.]|uniref:TlpA family protein disulfide reductase n=1 Tax=Chitinimonas sp. TaxID=1934313 RepID=UPI0035B01C14